jgi:hypothetical protein
MDKPAKNSSFLSFFPAIVVFFGFIVLCICAIPNFVCDPWTSLGDACINNLRRIDAAKNEWALIHNAKTNDLVTPADIKPYLEQDLGPDGKPYLSVESNGNLPRCPSGGIYTIGKISELPACSVGTNEDPPHVLN